MLWGVEIILGPARGPVAVDDLPGRVDRQAAVGVPVEREAEVGAVRDDGALQVAEVG